MEECRAGFERQRLLNAYQRRARRRLRATGSDADQITEMAPDGARMSTSNRNYARVFERSFFNPDALQRAKT